MKKLILLLFFTSYIFLVQGQQSQELTGIVTDNDGVGIPGVSIQVKGTQQGTITDLEGSYRISVPEDGILLFSFIGYETEEIIISGQTSLDVQLTETTFDMDEVVVVGYGTAAVKDITGTIAVVKADEIVNQPVDG